MYVAKLMLNRTDPMDEYERTIFSPIVDVENHCPKPVSKSAHVCIRCVVCGLETSIQKSLGIQTVDTCDQSSNHMATCINPPCDIMVQSYVKQQYCHLFIPTTIVWSQFPIQPMCMVCSLRFRNKYSKKSWHSNWWYMWSIFKSYGNMPESKLWCICTLTCFSYQQKVSIQDSINCWVVLFWSYSSLTIYVIICDI